MQREIKFRAWGSFGKKMHYQKENQELFSFLREFHGMDLMEFTGLHSKNGKEIYDGDWCTAEFRTKEGIQVIQGRIIMDEYMWCIDCTGCIGDNIFSINRPHNFEVIGNIYENPELIA